ncbi:MAG: Npt1/Npt2 family nucleotide transporter, partial [bacterium]
EWLLVVRIPKLGAIAIYCHIAAFGSILISGFWSMVNERFDPRSARRLIGKIGTGGTVGGVVGGLLAARASDTIEVQTLILLLALLHALCALLLFWLGSGDQVPAQRAPSKSDETPYRSGVRILSEQPYLRSLATLILLGTISAALIDYVFKARASDYMTRADSFLHFFAYYYTAVGIVSVVLQTGLSRLSLRKLGLAKTVGMLPAVVVLGSFGAVLVPQLVAAALARGAEAVIRNSLFRSAYEVLYTPVPTEEKRATKSIIDVGFERMGDILGGGITRLVLIVGAPLALSLMLFLALILASIGIYIARRLHQGYVAALERSLKQKAVELDIDEIEDKTTRQTVILTMAQTDLVPIKSALPKSSGGANLEKVPTNQAVRVQTLDPLLRSLADLRSGDPSKVRSVLRQDGHVDPALVPSMIQLLAWDEVAREALMALRLTASTSTGQLIDALLNRRQEFAIRRRIPMVLSAEASQRSADGLLLGMEDRRFEVRVRCGRALARIHAQNSDIYLDPERVFDAAAREVAVDKGVWESYRLLDQFEEKEEGSFVEDKFVKERANRSLEHVFTILSLALAKEPLRIAYRGLHTNDKILRGTALEYLEIVLPETVRKNLWPFLEDERSKEPISKSRDEILAELMKSNQSIQLSL